MERLAFGRHGAGLDLVHRGAVELVLDHFVQRRPQSPRLRAIPSPLGFDRALGVGVGRARRDLVVVLGARVRLPLAEVVSDDGVRIKAPKVTRDQFRDAQRHGCVVHKVAVPTRLESHLGVKRKGVGLAKHRVLPTEPPHARVGRLSALLYRHRPWGH